jgi:hypothetical protein
MKPRFATVIAAISLLLSCASVYWGMQSGQRMTVASFDRPGGTSYQLWGHSGKIALMRTHRPVGERTVSGNEHLTWGTMPYDPAAGSGDGPKLMWTSFSYATRALSGVPGATESSLVLPVWTVTALLGVAPTLWLMSKMRPKRTKGRP